jgi:predicted RNase H-like HicB family nuclease
MEKAAAAPQDHAAQRAWLREGDTPMQDFTLNIVRDGTWFIGTCPEVPAANGQGRTLMSCTRNLVQAIALLSEEEELPVSTSVDVEVAGISRRYRIDLIESLEGFAVLCPDLPGCCSQGDDEEEALENIKRAIKDYLEVAEELRRHQSAQLVRVA